MNKLLKTLILRNQMTKELTTRIDNVIANGNPKYKSVQDVQFEYIGELTIRDLKEREKRR